ncbi:glycosyl transferase group 1 [bacterium]|nr:glycosyl transferase group 1 [bacterium]|tara:strand:- start:2980 stop:4134 length:1155 start_codon:yes stop_codon:yes gene_type:complete
MHITISVGGRFHAFDLAREMERHGCLERLITSYPKFETIKYGIPKEKIQSILIKEIIQRGWKKLPVFGRGYNPYLVANLYDKLASRKLSKSDIVVAWSSMALNTLRKAKKMGAKGVVERGSSHIEHQQDILEEEYKKYGAKRKEAAHPKIIEKELQEYEEADYITVPTRFAKQTFIDKGISGEKIFVNPYGVDTSLFKQIPKEDDVFRVIFAGGMSLRKGVHYLLQAFAELNLPNSELLLIGGMNDEMKPFFKKYEGKYKYIGHVPQHELYKHYSQGSVFGILSIEEGLALVQPQAMACGLPLICTPNTGGEELVEDGKEGFIVPVRGIDAVKEKLTYLYENPDKQKEMGEAAKKKVQHGFTWNEYGDRMERFYKKVLKGESIE